MITSCKVTPDDPGRKTMALLASSVSHPCGDGSFVLVANLDNPQQRLIWPTIATFTALRRSSRVPPCCIGSRLCKSSASVMSFGSAGCFCIHGRSHWPCRSLGRKLCLSSRNLARQCIFLPSKNAITRKGGLWDHYPSSGSRYSICQMY